MGESALAVIACYEFSTKIFSNILVPTSKEISYVPAWPNEVSRWMPEN